MEHSTSAPNERVLRTTQLAKLSFNHPSVVLTGDVFQYLSYGRGVWKRDARFGAGLESSFSSFGETSLVVLTHSCQMGNGGEAAEGA